MAIVNRNVKLAAVAVLAGLAVLALGGCNTVEGMGQDVAAAGQTVADWAAEANPQNN